MPKNKRIYGKKQDDSEDSKKIPEVVQKLPQVQNTVEMLPPEPQKQITPQWGGQNKIEITPIIMGRAEKYAVLGMGNEQIAFALGMHKETLRLKCKEIPELALAIMKGRARGVNNIAQKIYFKALEQDDLQAQMFYLDRRGGWNKESAVDLSSPAGEPIELENKWTIEIIQPHIKGKEEK